ncbi:hypothetical protein ACXZ1M_22680 [Duganella sp. PWIR1]
MDQAFYNKLRNDLIEKSENDQRAREALRQSAMLFLGALNKKIQIDPAASLITPQFCDGKYFFTIVVRFTHGGEVLANAQVNFSAEITPGGILFICTDSGDWKTVATGDVLQPNGFLPITELIDQPLEEFVKARVASPIRAD